MMKEGSIFGISMGIGVLVALLFGQKHIAKGLWSGIAIAALIVYLKNRKK